MSERTTVHLVRHGEVHNPTGVLYGRLPGFRLSAAGEEMATVAAAQVAEMREQGLIKHLGVSVVNEEQVREAQSIAPVVTVQNWYNLAHRGDEPLIAWLAEQGISYVPFWPLGGFNPIQSDALNTVAQQLGASPQAVALAWLLRQSPNILLIPGTSSVAHLRENVAGAGLELPADAVAELDAIGAR